MERMFNAWTAKEEQGGGNDFNVKGGCYMTACVACLYSPGYTLLNPLPYDPTFLPYNVVC